MDLTWLNYTPHGHNLDFLVDHFANISVTETIT